MRYIAVLLLATAFLGLSFVDSRSESTVCETEVASYKTAYEENVRGTDAEQKELLTKVESLIAEHAAPPSACVAQLIEFRTYLLTQAGRYEDALSSVDDFDALGDDAPPVDLRARMIRFRGYLYGQLGETTLSARAYFRAAALTNELPAHTAAMTLIDASTAARELGNWMLANDYEEAAEDVLRDSLPARPDLAVRLGRVLVSRGHLLVERMLREPDRLRREDLATSLDATADSALALLGPSANDIDGGRRAEATGHKALAASWLGHHADAIRLSETRMALAESARNVLPNGVHAAAMQMSEIGERAQSKSLAWTSALKARAEAISLEAPTLEAAAQERLGELSEREHDLSGAATYYERAMELRELSRDRLEVQDWSASAFAEMQTPYRGLARVRVSEGRVEEGFALLDRTRARYLLDLQSNSIVRASMTGGRRAAVDSLLDQLEEIRVSDLYGRGSIAQRSANADTVASLQTELGRLLSRSTAKEQELDIELLRTALRASGQVLLSYLIDEEGSLGFVVSADTLVAVPLNVTRAEIELFLERVGPPWSGTEPDPGINLVPLHQLFLRLVSPLEPFIPEGAPLIITPDGPLAGLPFSMLLEAPPVVAGSQPFLIRSHAVSNELAAVLITTAPAQKQRDLPINLLAFGRSDFGVVPPAWRLRSGNTMTDLPSVKDEIEEIRSAIPGSKSAMNGSATEAAFYDDLSKARIVHVASHAEADATFPLYSRVMLWDDPDESDDGVVHLYELQNRNVAADLVVLSGCSTAGGQLYDGEGTLGIQFAVRAAGARSTLATLWSVDDKATSYLMDAFYRGLRDGLTRDRALQQAQLGYLDTHEGMSASPFFWAAPVLSGATTPIVFGDDKPFPAGAAGGIGLAILALAAALAWSRRQPTSNA